MCLEFWQLLPLDCVCEEGEGYKLVRRTKDPSVFKSYYLNFFRNSRGISLGSNKECSIGKTKAGCTYTIGVEHKVTHTRRTGGHKNRYRAGVHIWKTLAHALDECRHTIAYAGHSFSAEFALVKVKYSNPVAHDLNTVVAMRCTITEVIDLRSFTG